MRKHLKALLLVTAVLVCMLICVTAMAASKPIIVSQPKSVTVSNGSTASVSVAAEGSGLSYVWYYKDPGSSSFSKSSQYSATYSIEMNKDRSGRQLYCVIADKYGNSVKSNTVTIRMKLRITSQPSSVTVAKGKTASVSVTASGMGLKYQWYYKDPEASAFTKTSQTTRTYSIEMNKDRSGRQLFCRVTDKYGKTVDSDVVTIRMKLRITTQPVGVKVYKGKTASVSVAAEGMGLKYQWYYKDPGDASFSKSSQTSRTYSIEMTKARSGRQLYCKVTDKYGKSVKSNTVTIRMRATITKQPVTTWAEKGKKVSVSVSAVGDGLEYVWYYKDPGDSSFSKSSQTSRTYSIEMNGSRDCRQLYCKVTDKYGLSTKSNVVSIYMIENPFYGSWVLEDVYAEGYVFDAWSDLDMYMFLSVDDYMNIGSTTVYFDYSIGLEEFTYGDFYAEYGTGYVSGMGYVPTLSMTDGSDDLTFYRDGKYLVLPMPETDGLEADCIFERVD